MKMPDAYQSNDCKRLEMNEVELNQPIFELNISCPVAWIKFSLSGVDCGPGLTYGPYIGGIHLVELYAYETQQCHLPFISQTMVNEKCEVTVEYPDVMVRSEVILQARVIRNENRVVNICKKDVTFYCSKKN